MLNIVAVQGRIADKPVIRNEQGVNRLALYDVMTVEKKGGISHAVFFHCISYGKMAAVVGRFCEKGMEVIVSGHLTENEFVTRSNERIKRVEIIAERMDFVGRTPAEYKIEMGEEVDELDSELPFK